MNNPIITVVMAVYNGEKYIRESISCILNQTFKEFELLIINDGSTDKSIKIVEEYVDKRIRIIHNKKNMGILFTRNRGLQEALGKYVAVLDCDDICAPDRLMIQYNFLTSNSDIAICGTWGVTINEKSEVFGHKIMPETNPDFISITMLFNNQFIHSSVMMRKDVALSVGGYNSVNGCEDYGLFSRISIDYKMANIPEFLTYYREHSQGISKTKLESIRLGEKQILIHLYKRFDLNINLLEIPFSYIKNDFTNLNPDKINSYFIFMLEQNRKKKVFDENILKSIFFLRWYNLTRELKYKKCAFQLFKSAKKYNYNLSLSQKRKLFKIIIKI